MTEAEDAFGRALLDLLAVEAAGRRGVLDARVMAFEDVDETLGVFDTVVLYGNNFGLFSSRAKAPRLLRRLHRLTSDRGRIVASTRDPYVGDVEQHAPYHERNRARGRLGGQIRMRVRYRDRTSRWFDYLIVSKAELEELLAGTGWHAPRYLDGADGLYVAVIEKH